ncbi:MAG: phosphoribosylformylglycinamidine synthase subunit PurQ [Candidatus Altiarchaeales archaeon]|nr:phosphoribosylformylglycinamidine synthase subunit PurQ [Candidatus Altiarchaeales archaeon]
MKAAVLLIEGTNCEDESLRAFRKVGIQAEKIHLKQLAGDCSRERKRNLEDFDMLYLPGGWSAGDYVRAGAIFAARMKSKIGKDLEKFVDSGKFIMGVCNGFQILVEAGMLPGFNGISELPEAVLTNNADGRFQCRPTYLKHENKCMLTKNVQEKKVAQIPVAHAEGRLTFGMENKKSLQKLLDNKQVVFRYCMPDGKPANGKFPWNPNGSLYDIAGICNPQGNVLGMMPHPERVMEPFQQADWTRKKYKTGEGKAIFESIARELKKR